MELLHYLKNAFVPSKCPFAARATNLTENDVYSILKNERRRHVIHYLSDTNREVSIRELSEYIAEIEETDRQTLQIALYQQHIPPLAAQKSVQYDSRAKLVSPGPNLNILHQISQQVQYELN